MHGCLSVFVCVHGLQKFETAHSTPTTKFVDQIAKVVYEGELKFVTWHQQLQLAGFCHLGSKVVIT